MEEVKTKNCKKIFLIIGIILSLVFSIASLSTSIYTLYTLNENGVIKKRVVISKQYDKGQSYEKALKKEMPILVFFYVDWCGYCQKFAPVFNKIEKDKLIKKSVAIAYINCEDPANEKLIKEFKVQGFPAVYVINHSGEKTQLKNNTFFAPDSVKIVKQSILDILNK